MLRYSIDHYYEKTALEYWEIYHPLSFFVKQFLVFDKLKMNSWFYLKFKYFQIKFFIKISLHLKSNQIFCLQFGVQIFQIKCLI